MNKNGSKNTLKLPKRLGIYSRVMGPSRGVNSMKKRFTCNDHHCNIEKKKYWMVIKKYRKAHKSQDTSKGLPAERTMLWFFLCSDHQSNKKWDKKNQQKLAQKSQQVWIFLMIPTTSTISQKSIYEEFWKKIFSRSQEMLKHTEKQATTQTNKQTHFTVT